MAKDDGLKINRQIREELSLSGQLKGDCTIPPSLGECAVFGALLGAILAIVFVACWLFAALVDNH
jgi:hypothetical protein